jgi:hypothetical protein
MARKIKHTISERLARVNREATAARTHVMHLNGSLSTGAGGVLSGIIKVGDISTFSDYTNEFGTLYDEFRIIGGVLRFRSTMGPGHTNNCAIMAVCYDNDNDTGSPSSLDALLQYSTSRTLNCGRDANFVYEFTVPRSMNLWYDVASPSDRVAGIYYYATTLTPSVTYYNIEVEMLVEFRGRR